MLTLASFHPISADEVSSFPRRLLLRADTPPFGDLGTSQVVGWCVHGVAARHRTCRLKDYCSPKVYPHA